MPHAWRRHYMEGASGGVDTDPFLFLLHPSHSPRDNAPPISPFPYLFLLFFPLNPARRSGGALRPRVLAELSHS